MVSRFLFGATLILTMAIGLPVRAATDEAARLQAVLDDLDVMEALLAGKISDATRRELLVKVTRSRDTVRAVQQDLLRDGTSASVVVGGSEGGLSVVMEVEETGSGPVEVVEVVEVAQPEVFPMPPPAFDALRDAIEEESFDDEKLAILRDATRHNLFLVSQAIVLIELFTFSDGKVEAGVMLHPQVLDIENWYRVYGAYTFDSDKEELRKRLGL